MKNIIVSMRQNHTLFILLALGIMVYGLCLYIGSAHAQESSASKFIDILPTVTMAETPEAPLPAETTHGPIRLTPDKSEILKLDEEVGSIVIGNPAHLSILADTSQTLVLVPKTPGATHFSALNQQGDIIMQRHIIVAAPSTNYIRIKKTCADNAKGCVETSVYYCPDMCHEIESQGDNN